jgi:DNA gyrase subunit A
MMLERPDLSQVDPAVRDYVEALEAEIARLRSGESIAPDSDEDAAREPAESPTTINVVTISAAGFAKRTPRHLYIRQRRGGMGVFDLECARYDHPLCLLIADQGRRLVLITNQARAFHLAVDDLAEAPVHAKGESLVERLALQPGERPALAFPEPDRGYVTLASDRGYVRSVLYHYLGENLRPGAVVYDAKSFGLPAAACWSPGDGDLFLATRRGRAIRFPEKQVALQGGPGIRLEADDAVAAIAAVRDDSRVLLLSGDGKGTVRLMSGFAPNKEPGGGGKTAMKTDRLVGALVVQPTDDLFIISRLSKIIRLRAAEVPDTEGVVQGVRCMGLRADEAVALAASPAPS